MRKCIRHGWFTAFGAGMLAGLVLPQCWLAIAAAVMLTVVSLTANRCCTW